MHHNLNLFEGIADITSAVLHRRLEAQRFSGTVCCSYVGPCAIGIMLPEADRAWYDKNGDDDPTFPTYHESDNFTCDSAQYEDLKLLQEHHDALACARMRLYNHRASHTTALQHVTEEIYQKGLSKEITDTRNARRAFFSHLRHLQETYAHV